ncbi:hypothetical protein ONZ45_g7428 [Pleurotus djamor]|nr:hypothetical protein ONZ45_g7428 [Pleurotus djamor]
MRKLFTIVHILAVVRLVLAIGVAPGQITDFVTFGDSYTDIVTRGDGPDAQSWPIYVQMLSRAKLHPFAKSAATCSVNITFPSRSVFEYQLPSYFNETLSGRLVLDPEKTVYTLWIGTNDVGVKTLYDNGARNFIFQNMVPLQLAPMYYGNIFMKELVLSGNAIARLTLENMAKRLDGAHIALFDSYGLFWDMFTQPKLYLNGTVAPNVRGIINGCLLNAKKKKVCANVKGPARDSYLWYNALHPSEQADRIVAREIAAAIAGNGSQWATWLIGMVVR